VSRTLIPERTGAREIP